MLHAFKTKTKVSCYMGLKEKQTCHVTWVKKKKKSVMLHGIERKTKVSCYMSLKQKQNCHVTWV